MIGIAITAVDCGKRNDHSPLPGGRFTGDSINCTVWPSAATSAIAAAIGVAAEPRIRSTLSSVMKRRAFLTPIVGSVASSRMMTLSFSPATVVGHSLMPFWHGMPRAEVGPVRGRLTPIVTSARARPKPHSAATTSGSFIFFRQFMDVSSGGWERLSNGCDSTWRHAQRAIEANDFAVEREILDDARRQVSKFFWLAKALGERDAR